VLRLLEPTEEELQVVPGQQPAETLWIHWALLIVIAFLLCVWLHFLKLLCLKLLWVAGNMSQQIYRVSQE